MLLGRRSPRPGCRAVPRVQPGAALPAGVPEKAPEAAAMPTVDPAAATSAAAATPTMSRRSDRRLIVSPAGRADARTRRRRFPRGRTDRRGSPARSSHRRLRRAGARLVPVSSRCSVRSRATTPTASSPQNCQHDQAHRQASRPSPTRNTSPSSSSASIAAVYLGAAPTGQGPVVAACAATLPCFTVPPEMRPDDRGREDPMKITPAGRQRQPTRNRPGSASGRRGPRPGSGRLAVLTGPTGPFGEAVW